MFLGWPSTKAEVQKYWELHWSFIDGNLHHKKKKTLKLMHLNLMGIEITRLLEQKSIDWVNIIADLRRNSEKMPAIPGRLWKSVGVDISTINKKLYLCVVDYQRKFSIIKHLQTLSTDNLIKVCKTIFSD